MRNSTFQIGVLFLIILTAIMTQAASSQDEEGEYETIDNSLLDGAWAIQFQIDNYFTLKSFQGSIISLKRHWSPNSAVRLGLTGTFSAGDDTRLEGTSTNDTTRNVNSSTGNSNQRGLTINLQYLVYPNPEDEVNVFFGAGPLIQYSHSFDESNQIVLVPNTTDSYQRTSTTDRDNWYVGVSGVAGAEWFATKSISIHAEYGATLQYLWAKQINETLDTGYPSGPRRSTSELDGKSWRFSTLSVRFGLSAYF